MDMLANYCGCRAAQSSLIWRQKSEPSAANDIASASPPTMYRELGLTTLVGVRAGRGAVVNRNTDLIAT